jgi:hypothetical protein
MMYIDGIRNSILSHLWNARGAEMAEALLIVSCTIKNAEIKPDSGNWTLGTGFQINQGSRLDRYKSFYPVTWKGR